MPGQLLGAATLALLLAAWAPANTARELFQRPAGSREGRFLSAHLDLLSAASSLFPTLKSRYDRVDVDYDEDDLIDTSSSLVSFSKADKLVASENDLSESDTIRDMTDNLSDVEAFGAKLNADNGNLEDAISEQIDAMDASGGEPPESLESVFGVSPEPGPVYKTRVKSSYRRPTYEAPPVTEAPAYERPEGTPQPLIIICEDPSYCPPPTPSYPRYPQYRKPGYGGPGLTICRDPSKCRPHRPYRIKTRPATSVDPTDSAPTYEPVKSTPSYKKYGYQPHKPSNPTIWRQQVMKKVRKPAVKESDESYLSGPPAEHQADIENIRNIQKELLDNSEPSKVSDVGVKVAEIEEMSMKELKKMIKEAVIEEVELDKSEKLTTPSVTTTVAPVIEDAINKMTMTELKEFIMENVVETKQENIVVPEVEEIDVKFMSRKEMKDVIKDTVQMNDGNLDVVVPIIEETVDRLTGEELKEVLMEIVEKDKPEEIVSPLIQEEINHMSMTELKEFIADTVLAEDEDAEEIIAPLVENALKEMTKKDIKNLVMEVLENEEENTPEKKEESKTLVQPTNVDDINKMTMQELKDFIEQNSVSTTSQPPQQDKISIKDGMLFKNGMTMKEIKADEMGMSLKEVIGKEEGVRMRDVMRIKDGVTVEEMIAMKNDVSVTEMVAMKNDLTVEEVMKIKEVLPVAAIVQTRPEIPLEEAMALKSNMTIEELVAMKNDIPVEEVLELKDELEMESIMKLQDGLTKSEIVAIIDDQNTVEEIVELKDAMNEVAKLEGITIESERFPNFAKEGQKEMTIIDIDDDIVKFKEVSDSSSSGDESDSVNILDSVRNTGSSEKLSSGSKTRKKLQMKMRPLRVKVRKPIIEEEIENIPDAMDETFGLKNPESNSDLVLDPTPAVPGRPVVNEDRNQFFDFLPATTPTTPFIPLDNVKTVDYQNQDVTESEFQIYDTDDVSPISPDEEEAPFMTPIKESKFPDMNIPFSTFPMMKPHEFINLIAAENPDFMSANQEIENDSFIKLGSQDETDEDNFFQFNNPDRPESIPPYVPDLTDQNLPEKDEEEVQDDLEAFVDLFGEEEVIPEEERPVRQEHPYGRPHRRPQRPNPNHRYPIHPYAPKETPFTAKPKLKVVDHSYSTNGYKQNSGTRDTDYHGTFDSSDTALFREIPNFNTGVRLRRKPYQEKNSYLSLNKQSSDTKIHPFTSFGDINSNQKETYEAKIHDSDGSKGSLSAMDFHNQYGQHDDRPIRLPTLKPITKATEKDQKRPGEIRFGGMSFALPPPGTFPDTPSMQDEDEEDVEFEYYDYDKQTLSDVYPNHPASQIFPNRPVSDIFRDLPETLEDPSYKPFDGIQIKDHGVKSTEIQSFGNFFDQDQYVDNPFGKDFIKLEIDVDRFGTNKTKPGVHHIPLNIHGFPDIPNFNMNEETPLRRKVKKSTKNKPLYKPPPVLTKYIAPESSERLSQEYRHQYPDASSSNSKVAETSMDRDSLMGLSSFMENLMGKHSAWIKRAWQGRDEAAAAA